MPKINIKLVLLFEKEMENQLQKVGRFSISLDEKKSFETIKEKN